MKGVFTAPGDYVYFKSQVPLHKIPIGSKQWRYYDFGPKVVPPLICLPGTPGTADVYYKQVMSLSMKGYRVISVDIPRVWNNHEWIQAFEKFLDAIDVHHIHLYGTSLGGFLAQLFAQHRPRRVKSLVLSNTFLETASFAAAMPWASIVGWTPSFLLKRYVLTGIRDGPHEPFIADSVDFVVAQVETLSRDDLASRLSLTVDAASVGPLLLSDSLITIMDICSRLSLFIKNERFSLIIVLLVVIILSLKTNDFCAIPQQLKDQVTERYPGARQAYLKSGGDFPFLSRPDEVNLHLQLHLRRVGVEPQVPSTPKDDFGGSSSDQSDRKRDTDDSPEDDRVDDNGPGGPTDTKGPLLLPEGPDSGNFGSQYLSNAYLPNYNSERLVTLLLEEALVNRKTILASNLNFAFEYIVLSLLRNHFSNVYINLQV
ncbi:alpha/beta-Hydrolases superfamily protein [Striga asiatica]|uniref:Maspardin n=1 Tax=Striga asiatica TaxID=4170 RepID=A0A5A7P5E6_STRAF|nr:alpha/beta-Hydrolases superfamily protein [Striga asiatica]